MNKQFLTLVIALVIGLIGYSQAAPVQDVRIQNSTTPFYENLSVGASVYDITTKKLYKANGAVASTLTLTTGASLFDEVGSNTNNLQEVTDEGYTTTNPIETLSYLKAGQDTTVTNAGVFYNLLKSPTETVLKQQYKYYIEGNYYPNSSPIFSIGGNAGQYNRGTSIGLISGSYAGQYNSGREVGAILGGYAGQYNSGRFVGAMIGQNAGQYNTSDYVGAIIGSYAGTYNTGSNIGAILGNNAGTSNNGHTIGGVIGDRAGQFNKGVYIGLMAGSQAGRENRGQDIGLISGKVAAYKNTGSELGAIIGSGAGTYNAGSNNIIGHGSHDEFKINTSGAKTSTNIDILANTVTIPSHNFGLANEYVNLKITSTGQRMSYGVADDVLVVVILDENTILLDVNSNKIQSVGSGVHTFTPQYKYTNINILGNEIQPTASNQTIIGNEATTQTVLRGEVLGDSFNMGGDGLSVMDNAGGTVPISSISGSGVTDHNMLTNIGTNNHAAIDSHIANGNVHFTQSAISIPSTQITNFSTAVSSIADVKKSGTSSTNQVATWNSTGQLAGAGNLLWDDSTSSLNLTPATDTASIKFYGSPAIDFIDSSTIDMIVRVPTSFDNQIHVPTGTYSTSAVNKSQLDDKVSKTTSTDNAIVRFNGTTGEVQNSTATISDDGIVNFPANVHVSGGTFTGVLSVDDGAYIEGGMEVYGGSYFGGTVEIPNGTNASHAVNKSQLDAHTADATKHFTQSAISIPSTQISNFSTAVASEISWATTPVADILLLGNGTDKIVINGINNELNFNAFNLIEAHDIVGDDLLAYKYEIKGGTSSQFLKGDGSLDTTTYISTSSSRVLPVGYSFSIVGGNLVLSDGTNSFTFKSDGGFDIDGAHEADNFILKP